MLNAKILLSVAAVLAAYLCVSVGRRWWVRRGAWKREWSSGPRGASAVLPEIERLRKSGLSGAPVASHHSLAHRWLLAKAREVVAQLAFFNKPGPENVDAANHETQKRSG